MTDPAIREAMVFRSEFKFHLRDIPTEITVRFYNPVHSSAVIVRQSHTISIPGLDPQEQAACEDDSQEGEVLQSVVSQLVDKGLKPEASWLQANANFP